MGQTTSPPGPEPGPLPKKTLTAISLSVITLMLIYLASKTERFAGGGDTITHYLLSRFSWKYPHLLLDHWGKPVFTLISSPFAQFGLSGVVMMNILLGVGSAWLAWRVARMLNLSNAWIIPVLVCFTPVYTDTMLSGLTEVMFGFFLIMPVFLFMREKYLTGAVIVSFSLLVRTEGVFLIPLYGLFLLGARQYKALPFLLTGFVVYSIVGWLHFGDIFWLITHMPYRGATDIYGTGGLTHFFRHAPRFFNPVMTALLVVGLLALIPAAVRSGRDIMRPQNPVNASGILIALVFLAYFLAHSVMWKTGIGNSLGLHRYMASIVPLGAIVALGGMNRVFALWTNRIPGSADRILRWVVIILVIAFMVRSPFKTYPIPQKLYGMDLVVKQAADYIRAGGLDTNKIYFYDPALVIHLDLDPYDPDSGRERLYSVSRPQREVQPGSIFIWDAHFAGNSGLFEADILNNSYFDLVRTFEPDHEIIVFGREFRVHVFQRNDKPWEEHP
jgi:hypothetical protein